MVLRTSSQSRGGSGGVLHAINDESTSTMPPGVSTVIVQAASLSELHQDFTLASANGIQHWIGEARISPQWGLPSDDSDVLPMVLKNTNSNVVDSLFVEVLILADLAYTYL